MGGGVSKVEYERIRKELVTKEQVIRTLQDQLQETEKKRATNATSPSSSSPNVSATAAARRPSAAFAPAPSTGKVHRLSHAVVTTAYTDSNHTAYSQKASASMKKHVDEPRDSSGGDREGSSRTHTRRVEVSAEVISKKKILSTQTKERVVYAKSDASRELLMKILQSNVLFSGQTTPEMRDCLDAFFPMKVQAGTVVIKQGDQGEHFYGIESGQLEILVTVTGSPTAIRYGFLAAGMGFGELALLCNLPRAATIRAVTEVELWALERNTFREILASHKLVRLQKALQVLTSVPIFNKLTHQEMRQVAAAMEWEEHDAETTIIRQGEVGEHFYIITQGEVRVTYVAIDDDKSTEKVIRVMKAGDHFGEMALLKDEQRSATCTAQSHVQLLSLGRQHFIAMLGTLQELMDREPVEPLQKTMSGSGSGINRNASSLLLAEHGSDYKYIMQIHKDELEILQTLGRGAFGRVKLVRHAGTNTAYALKCLVKSRIVENNLKEHVLNEKRVMMSLDHPFILKLFSTYKDNKYIYLLLELALGGELFTYLRRRDRFEESVGKFYIASIVLVFQHVHSKSIAYRDLKPENILLDNEGFVKLADFGLAKLVSDRTWTLCGTPDYLAPEIILNKGHDKAVDYWALGILIYELLTGSAPFFAQDPMQIYSLIIQGNVKFPVYFGRSCVDLVQKLLCQNPARRLGNMKHGIKDIIDHKWFSGFNWDGLLEKKLKPPMVPQIRDAFDTSNFEDFRHEAEDGGMECDWDPDF